MTEWAYLTFKDGKLFDQDGDLYTKDIFPSIEEAEAYLVNNDLRATII